MPRERRLEGRRVFRGRLLEVFVDRVRLPGGDVAEREVVRHPGAVAVLPLLPGEEGPEVVLVRQYRYAAGEGVWEVPAGTLEPGEEPADCARRELEEETGLRAGALEPLGRIYTSPGFTDEVVHLFVAPEPDPGSPSPEDDERLEPRRLSLRRARELVERGSIVDAKTVCALLRVRAGPERR